MKTAEQWYRENYTSGAWSNWWNITHAQIRAIQLDAYKQGVTDAADACYGNSDWCPADNEECRSAILRLCEKKNI